MNVTIRNKCLVEVVDDGNVVAKATRADVDSAWHFGGLVNGKMTNCGELYSWIPEVLGRKMVIAVLLTFVGEVVVKD